ncbi:MAG: membrane dipeptidase [Gemmatimonadetes bacterium]|nr:membrane dipeptidase [Gemmatimonadota bacterium]
MPLRLLALSLLMFVPYLSAQDAALIARAKAIHDRVLTLDTHVDINPDNFTPAQSYATKIKTQVNVPAMEEGGLDAVFLIVFVGQGDDFSPAGLAKATASALTKFDAIDRLVNDLAPGRVALARSAADVRRIYASGKKVILIGVENGYQLGDDLGNVRRFAGRGARYLSLAHNGHSHLSDSNTGERDGIWKHGGLSPLGRQVIAELNMWGIMVDISHPSKASMMQTLDITQAPIIASHSAVRSLCNHSRNLDDQQLKALAQNGGVVQVVAFNSYLKCQPDSPERQQTMEALRAKYPGGLPDSVRTELNRRFPPPPRATVRDFADHLDYAVKLIGLDHVGISSDFDGGGGIEGWSNATETINVTIELVRRGYTEEQIGKLWSGNLLRVMEAVEKTGKRLRGEAS